jgi:hypothetical protein
VAVRREIDGAYSGYRHESPRETPLGEAPPRTPMMPMATSTSRLDPSGHLDVKVREFSF